MDEYVTIATYRKKFEVRGPYTKESHRYDADAIHKCGERVVQSFFAPEDLIWAVYDEANDFAKKHNEGLRPDLADLIRKIEQIKAGQQ